MFSDALRQLDKNTELYMIEELEKKIKSEKKGRILYKMKIVPCKTKINLFLKRLKN